LPETNARAGWSSCDFKSGFCIWRENPCAWLLTNALEEGGRKDKDITSKRGCHVIDLTNKGSSDDDEEQ